MGGMAEAEELRDSVDRHVARWAAFWKDDPRFAPEVEGALVRIYEIRKRSQRADAAAFADSPHFTLEDYKTLHALMVQPDETVATPAQLADMTHVTRARKERGALFAVVDCYRTPTVEQADHALIVRPGTDGALACAMIHVLLKEGYAVGPKQEMQQSRPMDRVPERDRRAPTDRRDFRKGPGRRGPGGAPGGGKPGGGRPGGGRPGGPPRDKPGK